MTEQSPRKEGMSNGRDDSSRSFGSPQKGSNNKSNNSDMMDFDDNLEKEGGMPAYRISRSSIISARNSAKKQNGDMSFDRGEDQRDGLGRRRRDSWDNPVDDRSPQHSGAPLERWDMPVDDDRVAGGIGKLKISREMKEKLEALTSSGPARYYSLLLIIISIVDFA